MALFSRYRGHFSIASKTGILPQQDPTKHCYSVSLVVKFLISEKRGRFLIVLFVGFNKFVKWIVINFTFFENVMVDCSKKCIFDIDCPQIEQQTKVVQIPVIKRVLIASKIGRASCRERV